MREGRRCDATHRRGAAAASTVHGRGTPAKRASLDARAAGL